MSKLDSVLGARKSVARLHDVLGAEGAIVKVPSTAEKFLSDIRAGVPSDVPDGLGTLAGAAVGFWVSPKHRVLGVISGASIGRNVPALLNPAQRPAAIRNMAQTGAGVLGSALSPKHRVVGFVVGWLLGGAAVYFGGL
jgi:hypothetical protein